MACETTECRVANPAQPLAEVVGPPLLVVQQARELKIRSRSLPKNETLPARPRLGDFSILGTADSTGVEGRHMHRGRVISPIMRNFRSFHMLLRLRPRRRETAWR